MNPGIAFALLALAQLVLAWLTNRSLEPVDKPLVTDQLRAYEALGIKAFFTQEEPNDPGSRRVAEVLRMTSLAASARATLTALVVSCVSLVITALVVNSANPTPDLKLLRLAGGIVGAGLTAIMAFKLFARIAARHLVARVRGEIDSSGKPKSALTRYRIRIHSQDTLTPYLTTALVANVVAILAAYGVSE